MESSERNCTGGLTWALFKTGPNKGILHRKMIHIRVEVNIDFIATVAQQYAANSGQHCAIKTKLVVLATVVFIEGYSLYSL